MKRLAVAGLFMVLAAACFLRCGDLGQRPLHNDEAINAFEVWKLWDRGEFRYDPHEYHGPALYYASLPVLAVVSTVTGQPPDERAMRAVAVLFGLGLILVLVAVVDGLGWAVLLWTALFAAVSPAFVYYSRYYIHEIPLVFFTAVTWSAAWRYLRRPSWIWAVVAGAGLGMMYATKETFVFSVAAALVASVGVSGFGAAPADQAAGWRLKVAVLRWVEGIRSVSWRHGAAFGAAGLLVWVTLFTSFFSNGSGPIDALKTYLIWFERAGGASPHIHPWSFYWERLGWFHLKGGPIWTEAMILGLALVGMFAVVGSRRLTPEQRVLGRFVAFYSLVLSMVYAAIPYKTPWCLLNFYHGYLVMAGFGAWHLVSMPGRRWIGGLTGALVMAGAGHLAVQSWRANTDYAADYRNPLVYGHTAGDTVNLLEMVDALSGVHEEGRRMPLQVMAPDSGYWPLPWYWRNFEKAGWWDHVPENPWSPVIVSALALKAGLEEKSERRWLQVGMFELRPRFFVEVYVEAGLWKKFLASRR